MRAHVCLMNTHMHTLTHVHTGMRIHKCEHMHHGIFVSEVLAIGFPSF